MEKKNLELLESIEQALVLAKEIEAAAKRTDHTDVQLLVRAKDHVTARATYLKKQAEKTKADKKEKGAPEA